MVDNGLVDLQALQQDIDSKDNTAHEQKASDFENNTLIEAIAVGGTHNDQLMGTIAQPRSKVNEKDNLLQYQLSEDKEENDLIEDMMNTIKKDDPASSSILKDGDIISTEQANKSVELD